MVVFESGGSGEGDPWDARIDAGRGDLEEAAIRFSRARPRLLGDLLVSGRAVGRKARPMRALFRLRGPGRVTWLWAQAGGWDDGD